MAVSRAEEGTELAALETGFRQADKGWIGRTDSPA